MQHIPRDSTYMACLTDFICREYAIEPVSITPAKRGYYGETWRLDTADGNYFLKLDYSPKHQTRYKNSLPVVGYLTESGIDFIGKIIKTRSGRLFSVYDSAVLGVFTWIDGENIETDETKIPEYKMLSKIYLLTKPGFDIPTLEFSDKTALTFFAKWNNLKAEPQSEENSAIISIFEQYRKALTDYAARLSYFASVCDNDRSDFYITHGDAGGNLLSGGGKYYIVDWDEVMYAPLERDAWVMCCRDWARKAFGDALAHNNIHYTLRPERLAFFCYHMFFLYLVEFLDDFTLFGKRREIEEYFDGFIMERTRYADTILP
ncbi:MAG: aminoglycoside phosphotransferase family protein [Oscillospiraceae bacterium]|nr:aminoglycoside phosphotransferase family protein [Oscillospiraceae bacterium]